MKKQKSIKIFPKLGYSRRVENETREVKGQDKERGAETGKKPLSIFFI